MPARFVLAVLCLFAAASAAAAPRAKGSQQEWWREGGPRLRPTDSRAAGLLQAGLERSATMRALVERIDAANIIVYIGLRPTMGPEQAGGLTFVGHAGTFRYLRVAINPGMASDTIIATLAHELQHVIEVIEHPEVTSETALAALYNRIGRPSRILGGFGWETEAAQTVGSGVRRELAEESVSAVAQARKQAAR